MTSLISVFLLLSKVQILLLHIFMVMRCLIFEACSVFKAPDGMQKSHK